MQVLEVLAASGSGLSLGALAAALSVPKTSLFALLGALDAAEYVRRTSTGFQLATASFRLAAAIGSVDAFDISSKQVMEELHRLTGESVLIGRLGDDKSGAVYLQRLSSPQAVSFTPALNERRPLYCTSIGKTLLACSPPSIVNAYLNSTEFKRFTPRTITSKRKLREELRRVQAAGFAVSMDEMVDGGAALAAPIFGEDGYVALALVIAAPTHRLMSKQASWSLALKDSAKSLTGLMRQLGGSVLMHSSKAAGGG